MIFSKQYKWYLVFTETIELLLENNSFSDKNKKSLMIMTHSF